MKPISIFLSGSMSKKANFEGTNNTWSSSSALFLSSSLQFPVDIRNPISIDVDECDSRNRFLADIGMLLGCDLVIVEASEKRGIGVGVEMALARWFKIPLYVISPLNSHYNRITSNMEHWIHPFILELADKVFDDMNTLVDYLNCLHLNKRLPKNPGIDASDVLNRMMSFDGGYDEGYATVKQFWGEKPASLVSMCAKQLKQSSKNNDEIRCLDLGCGHGKNSIYLYEQGFSVDAIDASYYGISEARMRCPEVNWIIEDIRKIKPMKNQYDLIVMTGSLHCLATKDEVADVVSRMKMATKPGGYHVISSFNSNEHDMSGHSPSFHPILMSHDEYLLMYSDWEIVSQCSSTQEDVHPHNNIVHRHSISRIWARKKNFSNDCVN